MIKKDECSAHFFGGIPKSTIPMTRWWVPWDLFRPISLPTPSHPRKGGLPKPPHPNQPPSLVMKEPAWKDLLHKKGETILIGYIDWQNSPFSINESTSPKNPPIFQREKRVWIPEVAFFLVTSLLTFGIKRPKSPPEVPTTVVLRWQHQVLEPTWCPPPLDALEFAGPDLLVIC